MKRYLIFGLLFWVSIGFSQVNFVIESLPESTPAEDFIYIAGSFNNWDPGNSDFKLQKNSENKWAIQLAAQANGTTIEFKFTRGDWGKVEKDINGNEIFNRVFIFGNGETVPVEIANWADVSGGNSTAAENVAVMDNDFFIPQLQRSRRIWIYLPPNYGTSEERYPVLYMHDGQNIFDAYTAFAGEWQVDETLNQLAAEGKNVPIVVGIDNGGGHRMDEYSAWVNSIYGGGEGDAYIRFITETLKPHIDQTYRTKSDAANTGIMGSSLGGFISHYAVLRYPDVFSRGGIFSPSYWYSDSVWAFSESHGNYSQQRFYQNVGSEEGASTIAHLNQMRDLLMAHGFTTDNLFSEVVQGQGHNEVFWKGEFRQAYLWLFNDFANGTTQLLNENSALISPNPATEQIQINLPQLDSLNIYNNEGQLVLSQKNSLKVSIQTLKAGVYHVEIYSQGKILTSKFVKL
jgi:predicted alpha/beta superfamily hydrolase